MIKYGVVHNENNNINNFRNFNDWRLKMRKGYKHTEEAKRKIGLAQKGISKTHSKESRRKMSLAHKGMKKPWARNNPQTFKKGQIGLNKGKKFSKEWKKNMSLANKGKHHSPSTEFKKGHIPQNPIKKGEHRGTKTEFKKGIIPWCLGTKGVMKPNRTSFQKGQKPWMKGKHHTNEAKKKLSIACKGRELTEEHKRKISESHKGGKHWNWQSGKSFEPYGLEFNNQLREQIRARDNYRCQECFRHQDELRTKTNRKYKLPVHHINYDKQNNKPNNLISLCKSCHQKTAFYMEEWTEYYQDKINEMGVY